MGSEVWADTRRAGFCPPRLKGKAEPHPCPRCEGCRCHLLETMCGRYSSPPDGGNNVRRCLHFTPLAPLLHPCVSNKDLGLRGRAVTKAAAANTGCRQDLRKCPAIRPFSIEKYITSSKAKCSPPLAFPLIQMRNNQAWKKERSGCDTQLKRHLWVLW